MQEVRQVAILPVYGEWTVVYSGLCVEMKEEDVCAFKASFHLQYYVGIHE